MRSIFGFFIGVGIWLMCQCIRLTVSLPPFSRRKAPAQSGQAGEQRAGWRVLVTGRVDSKNWCRAHLLPLTRAANLSELLLVMDGAVSPAPKIRQFAVPKWIGWFRPRAVIRSFWVIIVALKEKPDVVMAYSFFPPGLCALLAARFSGATAILQLPGGVTEIELGGWVNDSISIPAFLTRHLVGLCQRVCGLFDAVIVRGRKGEQYIRNFSHPNLVEIVPGSVDTSRLHLNGQPRHIDIAFIGRVVPIKQPEHICEVIRRVAQRHPALRVVIAGRGESLAGMKEQARKMGLAHCIRFVGHVERVEGLLARSRVFLLTSRSEGLSIALAEAMLAGVVPVVANVGDLSELVIDGQTGWLVAPGHFQSYADRICNLLSDQQAWLNMSANARQLALRNNGLDAVTNRWEKLFDVTQGPRYRPAPNLQTNPDPSAVTAFFSERGEPHSNQYDQKATFRDRLQLFVQSVQRALPPPARVLDFGCGPGNISLALAQLGYEVLGLDGASGMIRVGRERSVQLQTQTVRFEQVDSERFDPAVGPFDAVVCSSVLEYVEDDLGLLKRLIASLRPGGHLFISVPHQANVFAPLEPLAHAVKLRWTGSTEGHLAHTRRHYARAAFLRQLQNLGLEDFRCTSFECPLLGNLGIKLSRWSALSRMLLFEGRKTAAGPAPARRSFQCATS
jgi:glycosyltransferase involved in cell wall biosynthesis/SAM-dependent methyltransferase